jgi:glycosyltransferase involved in cell wall biosynthesis
MKILVITPETTGKYKDDTMVFCEGFEKLGHEVIRFTSVFDKGKVFYNGLPKGIETCDVVWAPFEPLAPVALWVKDKYNIPIVGHFEIIPPSISLDDVNKHWNRHLEPPQDTIYNKYRVYSNSVLRCDEKTVTCETHKRGFEKILGHKIKEKVFIRPYALDNEMFDKYRINVKEKYQVISSMRLMLYKKIQHVIKALSMLKNPPKYVVIGEGNIGFALKKYAKHLGLDVEFTGIISDKEKAKRIQESMFAIYPWSWLPPCEAAYYKKPSIMYDMHDTRERLFNLPVYTEDNNIEKLSETIKYLLDNPEFRKKKGEEAYDIITNGKCHTYKQSVACQKMLDIFKKVIK